MSLTALAIAAPLLIKISASGFGPVEWARTEKCEVYENQVVMSRTYGENTVRYEFPLTSQNSIPEMIAMAAGEKLHKEDNYLCDGPSTTVKAGDLLLYSTGGCGSPKVIRQGAYSYALMDMAGTFCQTTH